MPQHLTKSLWIYAEELRVAINFHNFSSVFRKNLKILEIAVKFLFEYQNFHILIRKNFLELESKPEKIFH